MRPVYFPQSNCIMGHDQTDYACLPAFRGSIPNHPTPGNTERIISAYRLSDADLERLCAQRVLWVEQLVSPGGPMQPQWIGLENPFEFENGTIWDGKGVGPENWSRKR